MKLDPTTTTHRLFECHKCQEPAASSAWSGRVVVKCDYCSFEDERELVLERGKFAARPYRDKAKDATREEPLRLDLGKKLPGLDETKLTLPVWRALLTKAAPEGQDDGAELYRLFAAVWLAEGLVRDGDKLRSRVVLETTLEGLSVPAYRAIALARLAQHAAGLEAVELAEKWLSAVPVLAVAEVESEIKAARAYIAFAQKDYREVRALTGGDTQVGAGFTLASLGLAILLNVEAHERAGETDLADQIMASLRRKKNVLSVVAGAQVVHGLGRLTIKRLQRKVIIRETATAAVLAGGMTIIAAVMSAFRAGPTALLALGATAVTAVCVFLVSRWEPASLKGWRVRTFLTYVVPTALTTLAVAVVRFGAPAPALPPPPPVVTVTPDKPAEAPLGTAVELNLAHDVYVDGNNAIMMGHLKDAAEELERCDQLFRGSAECAALRTELLAAATK